MEDYERYKSSNWELERHHNQSEEEWRRMLGFATITLKEPIREPISANSFTIRWYPSRTFDGVFQAYAGFLSLVEASYLGYNVHHENKSRHELAVRHPDNPRLSSLKDEELFWVFYYCPGDEVQAVAAHVL